MDSLTSYDVQIEHDRLKGRTFLLGNKRAFSLALPAASGTSDALFHPHKWFGAYLYGRKFFEAQLVRAYGQQEHILSRRYQTRLTAGLTFARRDYEVEGESCSEEFFVPDGVQGFACTLTGNLDFVVEPELDMRFARTLSHSIDTYSMEAFDNGVIVSNPLPSGTFDDATEAFHADDREPEVQLYAAIQVVGEDVWKEMVPPSRQGRRKVFRKDYRRRRFVEHAGNVQLDGDHAPLWNQSSSRAFAPVRLHLQGRGTVVYGFGASRDEALQQLEALRDNLIAFQAQKYEAVADLVSRAQFETGDARADRAAMQVLARLMDALVARHAVAEDTALARPATMILAGNQYFHDSWKRDENIALGFMLSLGFYDLAREVIRDTWQLQDESTGRLPQRIRAGEDPPYHSSDGTLWALWRLYQYWRCTGDDSLVYEKLGMVKRFFQQSLERAVRGLLPSGRTTTPDYLWETWMDTPHTPRDGFPIEIQMLWVGCLRVWRPLVIESDPELELAMAAAESAAWQALQAFNVRGMPADSLDENGVVRDLITPNPYFCFGVGIDLGPQVERAMRDVGRRQLAGHQGIVTLAPQDWNRVFPAEFLSDRRNVRGRRMRSIGKFNYHRGVEWNWLSQFFVWAELKYGDPNVALRKYLQGQIDAVLDRAGIGGISELFDLSGTRGPEFQAWSMSGFLEALHAFTGVRIDVPEHRISIAPQLPARWPHLKVRKWYGSVPFDLTCRGDDEERSLQVEFPWGEPVDASIEVQLVLPKGRTALAVELTVDGVPHDPVWRLEPLSGTMQDRICLTVPAGVTMNIEATLAAKPARVAR
ncbi:MAG TPA: amylo-alpha-1,6-glucosidase, partial [Chloroflexota bacterium]